MKGFFLSDFIAHASKRTGKSKGDEIDIVGKDWTKCEISASCSICLFLFPIQDYVNLEMDMIYGASLIFE